jgi:fatty acid desaturase
MICYIYYLYSINYYRKEIKYRIADGYVSKKKYKAPFSLRKSVLFCVISTAVNALLQIIFGDSLLILINFPFVVIILFILKRYERRLRKIEKEFYK